MTFNKNVSLWGTVSLFIISRNITQLSSAEMFFNMKLPSFFPSSYFNNLSVTVPYCPTLFTGEGSTSHGICLRVLDYWCKLAKGPQSQAPTHPFVYPPIQPLLQLVITSYYHVALGFSCCHLSWRNMERSHSILFSFSVDLLPSCLALTVASLLCFKFVIV